MKFRISCALMGAAFLFGNAYAGPLHDVVSNCTTINCQAMDIRGDIIATPSQAGRWNEQLRSGESGRCLRIDVRANANSTDDLEIVVVAPDGTVFRDDDSGPGLNPLVVIQPTIPGYYTVSIGHFSGTPTETAFRMWYGMYNIDNHPNCNSPTPPVGITRKQR